MICRDTLSFQLGYTEKQDKNQIKDNKIMTKKYDINLNINWTTLI